MEKKEKRQKQKETFKKVLRYIVSGSYGSAYTLHSDFDR